MIRVRFAPSPTGNLHIGTLRTALFTWLFARRHKGVVVLRIEDTDMQRSSTEFEVNIFEGLEWFGLDNDEGPREGGEYGPYRQSERIEAGIYSGYIETLLASGHAYYCFDTAKELSVERDAAMATGVPYKYSRKALELSEGEVKAKLDAGEAYTIRFKMPDSGWLKYKDMVRGKIAFDNSLISDFVIMKSDGTPSYNFAVVVDDLAMKISHVIRGEDHISNMPRQAAVFAALGATLPEYGHLPMILGPDKAKLSKRHGATSVTEYRDQGFYSPALFNYLSLLGWSPEGQEEFFTKDEIVSLFSTDRVAKANAVFDQRKLTWMNGQYLRRLDVETYEAVILEHLDAGLKADIEVLGDDALSKALLAVRGNLEVLNDINTYGAVFVKTQKEYESDIAEISFSESNIDVLTRFRAILKPEGFSRESFDAGMAVVLEQTGLGKGAVFLPIRLAVSGQKAGPHLGDFAEVVGVETILARLSYVISLT